MGLLDALTGGENKAAKKALERAYQAYAGIQTPTAAQLTLPEIQKYVQAGIMTPAEAKAALVQGNAYNDINLDPSSMMGEQDALNKLKGVSDAGGMTPTMKAQLTAALDQVATQERGTNAGIADQFSQRGIPASLMAEAAMREESGNASRNANLAGTQAAGQAEQNAIAAMMNQGNLASTMHGQVYNEAQNKANAENALRQWNAGATNTATEANAGRTQEANRYNTATGQDVSNQNVTGENQRTAYNTQVPQTVFNNAMSKASGMAGVNQAQANQSTAAGNQIMGLVGAGVGAAANAFAPGAGAVVKPKPDIPMYADGAVVPGTPEVPGDSLRNDKVHAMLSPGEVVIPRSIAPNPDAVKNFVQKLMYQKKASVHPDDVHSVLEALTRRRSQNIHSDGRDFEFTPGEGGSLTTKSDPPIPLYSPHPSRARVVTGSTRG